MDRGALGTILRICRVVGVAPFKLGDEYHVSLPLVICAKLFISITAINFVLDAAISTFMNKQTKSVSAFGILNISGIFCTVITAFVSVFSSSSRIVRFVRFLKELKKLNKEISEDYQSSNERILTALILMYLHVTIVLRSYDFLFYNNTFNITKITPLHFMILMSYYMVDLSELQIALFIERTSLSLKLINESLEKLCKFRSLEDDSLIHIINKLPKTAWEDFNEVQSINARWEPETRVKKINESVKFIRQCAAKYLYMCNIIITSTKEDALLIAIIIMRCVFHLLKHSYKVIVFTITPDKRTFDLNLFLPIYYLITHCVTLAIFVEPTHKIQGEIQRLQKILTTLKLQNLDKDDIYNELFLFWQVIELNNPIHSPLGMFNLNRSLVVKVFGTLVTYLVIVITYGPETKTTFSI